MSQERTRFPIQPKDVRRSAQSNRDVDVAGGASRKGGTGNDQDKPTGPPPRPRRARAKDEPADEKS